MLLVLKQQQDQFKQRNKLAFDVFVALLGDQHLLRPYLSYDKAVQARMPEADTGNYDGSSVLLALCHSSVNMAAKAARAIIPTK
jgi:hypothetical protein